MQVSRRNFLQTSSAAGLAAVPAPPPEPARAARPNLILYMADELRAESIACYGHPLVKTPHLDSLASQGTRFAQCHVQNPVCAPSRCSLATGWPVHVHGHRSLYYLLRPEEPNLFRYLKESGYDVYFFGKNDLFAPDTFASSVTRSASNRATDAQRHNLYPPGDPHFYSFMFGRLPDRRGTADYANLRAAIEILEQQPRDRPFCIFLPLTFPHPPYSAPEEFQSMYAPAALPELRPANLPRQPLFHSALRRKLRLDQLSDADFRATQAVYLGMVSYTDWLLGELLAALDRTHHVNDTALFFFADHGDFAGDYGLVEKWPNALNDVLTHIPLIARVPGYPSGVVCKEIVELYDVMATCLALAGVEARHTHFAHSLLPQLSGQPGDPQRAAFSEGGYNVNEPQCFEPLGDFANAQNMYYPKVSLQNQEPATVTRASMVRTLHHKLILCPDGQSELYDLDNDPRELHNVYDDKAYATHQSQLSDQLRDWYIRTADVAPKKHDPRAITPK